MVVSLRSGRKWLGSMGRGSGRGGLTTGWGGQKWKMPKKKSVEPKWEGIMKGTAKVGERSGTEE